MGVVREYIQCSKGGNKGKKEGWSEGDERKMERKSEGKRENERERGRGGGGGDKMAHDGHFTAQCFKQFVHASFVQS